jgi:hypothetical protein
MTSGDLLYWSTDKKTVISFIKTGTVGQGTTNYGLAAQFNVDDWVVAKISIKAKISWITKSCVTDPSSRIQNIQLGNHLLLHLRLLEAHLRIPSSPLSLIVKRC